MRHIKLECSSVPKPKELEINLEKVPVFIEGEAEQYNRKRKNVETAENIKITDFTSKYHRTLALALFV